MSSEKTVKEALKAGKVIIGKESVTKAVKKGKLSSVFYAVNCTPELIKEMEYYSKVSNVPVDKFGGNSAELGQLCGKPFKIVILGIEK